MKVLSETSLNKLLNLIKGKIDIKVDKVEGKKLSTNDYTNEEKTKLEGIAIGANNYTLPVASTTLGGIKSGADITVDGFGNVSVNDDSHNHVISNIDDLQNNLDAKQSKIIVDGLLKGNGSGIVSVAVAGTDYQAPIGLGNIAREKLANDALYSPINLLGSSAATSTISINSIGKTIVTNNSSTDFVLTVPADTDIPIGFEVAIFRYSAKSLKITFASGVKVLVYGNTSPLTASSFTLDIYAMVALKKLTSDTWILTGPAEVVL